MQCTSIHIHQRNDIILVDNNTAHVNAQRMQPLGPVLTRNCGLWRRVRCPLACLAALVSWWCWWSSSLPRPPDRRPYFCPYSCVVFYFFEQEHIFMSTRSCWYRHDMMPIHWQGAGHYRGILFIPIFFPFTDCFFEGTFTDCFLGHHRITFTRS